MSVSNVSMTYDGFCNRIGFNMFEKILFNIPKSQIIKIPVMVTPQPAKRRCSSPPWNSGVSRDRIWRNGTEIWPDGGLVVGRSGGGGPKGWGPEGRTHNFARNFILPSLGGLIVDFWWCLKRRGAQMCAFGFLLLCEARRPQNRWGFTPQPESPNVQNRKERTKFPVGEMK